MTMAGNSALSHHISPQSNLAEQSRYEYCTETRFVRQVYTDVFANMCVGMCMDMCEDMRVDMRVDMHADMRVDMFADMYIGMSGRMGVWVLRPLSARQGSSHHRTATLASHLSMHATDKQHTCSML